MRIDLITAKFPKYYVEAARKTKKPRPVDVTILG